MWMWIMPTAKTSGGRGGRSAWLAKAAGSNRTQNKRPASPLRSVVLMGPMGAPPPTTPGVQKPEAAGKKKTGRGNGKGGRGNRGPGPAGGRDREPLGRGASDTPLPQLVASLPGINGASAYGPLERVTPCRLKVLGTSTSPRVRTARQPPQSAMGRPAAPRKSAPPTRGPTPTPDPGRHASTLTPIRSATGCAARSSTASLKGAIQSFSGRGVAHREETCPCGPHGGQIVKTTIFFTSFY